MPSDQHGAREKIGAGKPARVGNELVGRILVLQYRSEDRKFRPSQHHGLD
jgi:hypothetical protein